MILISHRGNINGPDPLTENSPKQIQTALDLGFNVEIDVWVDDGKIYLGHDVPQYQISSEFLHKSNLWIHCKNKEALEMMSKTDYNYFWHNQDDYTLTSKCIPWVLVGKDVLEKSICVLPEKSKIDFSKCLGICTDLPVRYRKELFGRI